MNILITGGTGSFGKAMTKRLLQMGGVSRLVIYSRDELKQSEMQAEMKSDAIRFFIGDVRDRERLELAMYGIDTVIHAAALKQVPVAEYNPFECIRTNVYGAENVCHAARNAQVKKVIALSSDKAVAPINLYGASKLAADKIFIAANPISRGTRFSIARYGNVLGSRGSVVELFQKIIASGVSCLPITHKDMTRFWLTLEQGVDFVLSCLDRMQGGEIFVPKIPSMSIVEVAKAMLPDCTIKETGIRPGEKLHEVLITEDEQNVYEDIDRYVIQPSWLEVCPRTKVRYASNTNKRWLTREEFLALLGGPAASPVAATPPERPEVKTESISDIDLIGRWNRFQPRSHEETGYLQSPDKAR